MPLSFLCSLTDVALFLLCFLSCSHHQELFFLALPSLPLFSTVRETTDGADKFHNIEFSLPMQFFTEVRTNYDSSRCYSLSISVKRLFCRTFAPYKSLLGTVSSLLVFSLVYELQFQTFTWTEIRNGLARGSL